MHENINLIENPVRHQSPQRKHNHTESYDISNAEKNNNEERDMVPQYKASGAIEKNRTIISLIRAEHMRVLNGIILDLKLYTEDNKQMHVLPLPSV